jgi:hypothetical protein
MEKMKVQVLLASMKTLTNPLQNAYCGFWKLFRKPEMMVKNSKNFEAGFGITFQNLKQMIGCRLFQRLN